MALGGTFMDSKNTGVLAPAVQADLQSKKKYIFNRDRTFGAPRASYPFFQQLNISQNANTFNYMDTKL